MPATDKWPAIRSGHERKSAFDSQAYLREETAKALGFNDAAEMVADYRFMREQAEKYRILELSSSFHSRNQDFPNTDHAVEALEAVCRANNWDMENIDNLSNAHAVAVRHGLYEPLSQEQIRASVRWTGTFAPSNSPADGSGRKPGHVAANRRPAHDATRSASQAHPQRTAGRTRGRQINGAGKSELHHTGQEFQSACVLGAWWRVFDGRESILPARGKKISYGLGARTWITPARAATSEQGSLCSTPASAANRRTPALASTPAPDELRRREIAIYGRKAKAQAVP